MKAITIWQPWASLILGGFKPYEFRSRPYTAYGYCPVPNERIAIHAGMRKPRREEVTDLLYRAARCDLTLAMTRYDELTAYLEKVHANLPLLPLGVVLCTAVIGKPVYAKDLFGGAIPKDSDREEHWNWAWPLEDIQPLDPPVEAKGKQGFWYWKESAA